MTEHKFPQDYTIGEWLAIQCKNPFSDAMSLTSDYVLRKNGVAGLLVHAGRMIKDLVDSDGNLTMELEDFKQRVDQELAVVASSLDGAMPSTRWVVLDYQVDGVNDKGELVEYTRPHQNITQQYWDQVNG